MKCATSGCNNEASKQCSRCKNVGYCSVQCQTNDWHAGHKNHCRKSTDKLKPLFEQKEIDKIWYADRPLSEGGAERKISVDEFMEIYASKTHDSFIYTENLWANSQIKAEKSCHDTLDKEFSKAMQILKNPNIDKIVICFVSETVGFAAYARCDIPAWDILGIYAGIQTTDKITTKDDYQIEMPEGLGYVISANKYGGFARFLCHLPLAENIYYPPEKDTAEQRQRVFILSGIKSSPKYYDKLRAVMQAKYSTFFSCLSEIYREMIIEQPMKRKDRETNNAKYTNSVRMSFNSNGLGCDPKKTREFEEKVRIFLEKEVFPGGLWNLNLLTGFPKENCLTGNVSRICSYVNGYVVPYLYSIKDIKRGELLGFDYGNEYWATKGVLPELFDISSRLIPRDHYHYSKAQFQYDANDDGNNCFITRKQYYTALPKQHMIQTTLTSQRLSFFKVRDFLVTCNVIPKTHAAVEHNMFAQQLQNLFKPIDKHIVVKSYFHNPEATINVEQYSLDVVCYFPQLLHWHNMARFIKTEPKNIALIVFCKYLSSTQEIIFRNVNIFTGIMSQFISHLRTLHLSKYLNENADLQPGPSNGYVVGDVLP